MTEQTIKLTQDQLAALESIDLLDLAIEEIPESPDFVNPPTGIYHCEMGLKQGTYSAKVYKDGKLVEGETKDELKLNVNFKILTVLEVADADLATDEEAPRPEDMFGNGYFGKRGVQDCVNDLSKVAKHLGATTGRALLEAFASGARVPVVVAVERTRRKSNDTVYLGIKIKSLEVADA